jgi:hypothetical protein
MRLGHLEATWRLQLDFRTDLARQAAQIVSRFVTNNPAHRRQISIRPISPRQHLQ